VEQSAKLYGPENPTAVEDLYQKALALRLKTSPGWDTSPLVYEAYVNLGKFYFDSNRPADAEVQYRAAIEVIKKLYGATPDSYAYVDYMTACLKGIGDALARQSELKKLDEAITVYKQMLELLRKSGGDRNNEVGEVLRKLAGLYMVTDKDEEADATILLAAEAYEKAAVKDVQGVYTSQNSLGQLFFCRASTCLRTVSANFSSGGVSTTKHRRCLKSLTR
jgi:tetratricopeptide (TPR) repeat protein